MPSAHRLGDLNTGHDSCAPVVLIEASEDVFINGLGASRLGDAYASHGCDDHPDHSGTLSSGSAAVFINGLSAGRVGDSVSCGGTAAEGSDNVYIGG